MDGLLAIFVAGSDSEGIVVATVLRGRVIGADFFGSHVDGTLEYDHEKNLYNLFISVKIPRGASLIQGGIAPDGGVQYEISAILPKNFDHMPYVSLETPHGAINARFQILRTLET